jgi:hypothetical protein
VGGEYVAIPQTLRSVRACWHQQWPASTLPSLLYWKLV